MKARAALEFGRAHGIPERTMRATARRLGDPIHSYRLRPRGSVGMASAGHTASRTPCTHAYAPIAPTAAMGHPHSGR